MRPCTIITLPPIDYGAIHTLQTALVNALGKDTLGQNVVVLCSHPPCYTLGRGSTDIEKGAVYTHQHYPIERGGRVTAHHPEQLIVYPILKLNTPDVHAHLHRVLRWGHDALNLCGVDTLIKTGESGLYVNEEALDHDVPHPNPPPKGEGVRKIAAVGIAVKRWITYHGLAINVNVDPSMWDLPDDIHPCGLPHVTPINARDIQPTLTRAHVEAAMIKVLQADAPLNVQAVHAFQETLSLDAVYDLLLP